MKKIISLLSSFAFGITLSNAQITITSADVVGVGKVLYQATDTMKSLTVGAINPGPAGANKTWNFSNLLSNTVDTMIITNPAWTTSGTNFPGSNLAGLSSDSTIAYFENTATGLYVHGAFGDIVGQGAIVVKFNPKEQITSFPNTYNSTFQNTSNIALTIPFTGFTGVDSARFKEKKYKNVLTDGWGSITTPLGTYNCIRQKALVIATDSIWVHSIFPSQWNFISVSMDTTWHFTWWANGVGFPILDFDSTAGDTIRNITWLKSLPVIGGVHENPALNAVSAYPNPSAGKFMLSVPNTANSGIAEVYTVLGDKILTVPVPGGKEGTINLSSYPDGIYFLKIRSKEGITTRKLVVSR